MGPPGEHTMIFASTGSLSMKSSYKEVPGLPELPICKKSGIHRCTEHGSPGKREVSYVTI